MPGYASFFFGPIRAAPLAALPNMPLRLPVSQMDDDTPPPPPPSPEEQGQQLRRGRRARAMPTGQRRESARLANQERAQFSTMADKATQLKALKNALEPCSHQLKVQVQKKGLLAGIGKPVTISTIRKLVSAAGLGCAAEKSIAAVEAGKE